MHARRHVILLKSIEHVHNLPQSGSFRKLPMHKIVSERTIAQHRVDISGLRCIAMAGVVLYHFSIPSFSGGFFGIDIFFVISGYLMTSIIFLRRDNLSIISFYISRCIRIIPALYFLISIVIIFGWIYLEPITYKETLESILYSSVFSSNLFFIFKADYFAPASENFWLLHTWTLSVEWQFYLLYPIALACLFKLKIGERGIFLALALVFLFSLALSVTAASGTARMAIFGFYSLPTRAWEMAAGGMVFFLGRTAGAETLKAGGKRILELAGLLLCLAGLFLFDRLTPWPSYNAVLPVLATSCVLLASAGHDSLLRASPIQRLGDWSYSIYLWHWPVVVFLRETGQFDAPLAKMLGIAASVALGGASYNLVEQPFRRIKEPAQRRRVMQGLAATAAGLAGAAIALTILNGVPSRAAGDKELLADAISASQEARPQTSCRNVQGGAYCPADAEKARTAILGDSHSLAWLSRYGLRSDARAEAMWSFSCPPMPNFVNKKAASCADFHEAALTRIRNGSYRSVIYAAMWPSYFERGGLGCRRSPTGCHQLSDTIEDNLFADFYAEIASLRQSGIRVIVMLPTPVPDKDLPRLLRQADFSGQRRSPDTYSIPEYSDNTTAQRIEKRLRKAEQYGAIIVDPRQYMCSDGSCPAVAENGRSLYADSNHLRPWIVQERLDFLDPYVD